LGLSFFCTPAATGLTGVIATFFGIFFTCVNGLKGGEVPDFNVAGEGELGYLGKLGSGDIGGENFVWRGDDFGVGGLVVDPLFVVSPALCPGTFSVLGLGDGRVALGAYVGPLRTRGVGGVSGGIEAFTFLGVASPVLRDTTSSGVAIQRYIHGLNSQQSQRQEHCLLGSWVCGVVFEVIQASVKPCKTLDRMCHFHFLLSLLFFLHHKVRE